MGVLVLRSGSGVTVVCEAKTGVAGPGRAAATMAMAADTIEEATHVLWVTLPLDGSLGILSTRGPEGAVIANVELVTERVTARAAPAAYKRSEGRGRRTPDTRSDV